ncbi:MAG: peptidase S15, partial [Actinomycetota bacterium]|nr:peptidase S15 [Actinomycetota bacterium]
HALSYVTEPLAEDTTVLGSGYVRVWLRSDARSVDLQATISEVRPDDKEAFVQGGWLRASMRKLDRQKSTPLEPVLSLRKSDMKPLPGGRFVRATIPLYYQGHGYREGSRIRVTISAVGGDQPIWAFARAKPKGTPGVDVAFGKSERSKLTLPVLPGADIPTELPPCPGLRGEPCRDYVPFENG